MIEELRRQVARRLERGVEPSPPARLASAFWGDVARPARPLRLPPSAALVGIGGATLGGSGKTPLVVALAASLAARGHRLAVVAHGYRGRPGSARVVTPRDPVASVGDEALELARALETLPVSVVVARRRQSAVDLGAREAPLVLIDGLLQAHPRRLALSLLVVDGTRPWGAGRCPPLGDLRARRDALLAQADAIVAVTEPGAAAPNLVEGVARPVCPCPVVAAPGDLVGLRGADGARLSLRAVQGLRVGLLLTQARPERVLRALERHGIAVHEQRLFGDHARVGSRWAWLGAGLPAAPRGGRRASSRGSRVDLWLTTSKGAVALPAAVAGAPVLALDYEILPPVELVEALGRLCAGEQIGGCAATRIPC